MKEASTPVYSRTHWRGVTMDWSYLKGRLLRGLLIIVPLALLAALIAMAVAG